jgi:hypothetical protein
VTGEAFRTGKVIYADKIKTLGAFMSSVDNLALDIKDVRSIMVIPVFPHHSVGDDLKPIAVVQLINKVDHKLISEHDIVS